MIAVILSPLCIAAYNENSFSGVANEIGSNTVQSPIRADGATVRKSGLFVIIADGTGNVAIRSGYVVVVDIAAVAAGAIVSVQTSTRVKNDYLFSDRQQAKAFFDALLIALQ